MNYNKVYDWKSFEGSDIETSLKRDLTNIGVGIGKKVARSSLLVLNLDYIHKGALLSGEMQDYTFKYLVLSPSFQYSIINDYLKVNAGLYLGYLLEYNLNGGRIGSGRNFDFGYNLGVQSEYRIRERLNVFLNPMVEIGLIKLSNSKLLSTQLRIGLKYKLHKK